jgi:hypothetical protein
MLSIMTKLVNLHTAPDVDIIFSGDPLDYAYFRAAFKEVVEEKVSDSPGKLTRLLKYTSGEAKDLIKHCIHETKNDCFEMAIQLLDKEYGNKQLLVNHYLNKLRNWPKISPNNSSAYKKLHRFLLSGLIYKRDGNLSELDSETVIRTCVLAKMDRAVQGKWLNKVVRTREKGEKDLKFKDLVNFVEHLSLLASEPSYSQDAYKNDPGILDMKSYGINVQFAECIFCSEVHNLDECKEFKDLRVVERANFIWQNRLCYNCLKEIGENHVAKTCPVKSICNICKEEHHTYAWICPQNCPVILNTY